MRFRRLAAVLACLAATTALAAEEMVIAYGFVEGARYADGQLQFFYCWRVTRTEKYIPEVHQGEFPRVLEKYHDLYVCSVPNIMTAEKTQFKAKADIIVRKSVKLNTDIYFTRKSDIFCHPKTTTSDVEELLFAQPGSMRVLGKLPKAYDTDIIAFGPQGETLWRLGQELVYAAPPDGIKHPVTVVPAEPGEWLDRTSSARRSVQVIGPWVLSWEHFRNRVDRFSRRTGKATSPVIGPENCSMQTALQVGNSIVYCFANPGSATGFVVVDEKGVVRGSTDAYRQGIEFVVPVHGIPAGLLLVEDINPGTRVMLYRWDLTNKPVPVVINVELPPDAARERHVPD